MPLANGSANPPPKSTARCGPRDNRWLRRSTKPARLARPFARQLRPAQEMTAVLRDLQRQTDEALAQLRQDLQELANIWARSAELRDAQMKALEGRFYWFVGIGLAVAVAVAVAFAVCLR